MFDNPSQPKSILDKYAADENWHAKPRRRGYLGATCGVLALGLAGAAWYTFPILKRHDAMLAQSAGMKRSVETLGGRLDQQNAKLSESSGGLEQLRQQIADLRREMRSRIAAAKKQAGDAAYEMVSGVKKEVSGEIAGIKTHVARLELSRDADQVQIADLQNEVIQLRKELAAETEQLSDRLAANGAGTEQKIAGLVAAQEQDRKDVDGLSRKLSIRRVDFEVNKGRNVELAPGISLEISGTDVPYRRVSGWMWVLPDRRTIWLRQQGAQEPVVFYSTSDGKKRELVITSVTDKSAVGYLLLPGDEATAESAAAVTQSSAAE
jgi:hypothetical protein